MVVSMTGMKEEPSLKISTNPSLLIYMHKLCMHSLPVSVSIIAGRCRQFYKNIYIYNIMQKIILLSFLLVTLYGCAERMDISTGSSFPEDGIIRVSAETSGTVTRAGIENSGDLMQFRLSVINPVNSKYSYNNIEMQREGDGFTASKDGSPLTMFWQNSSTEVNIISSTLPVNDQSQSLNVSVASDQSTPENIKSSDFLYFKSESFTPETDLVNGKIPIRFTHMCSKLIYTVTLSDNYNVIQEATVKGAVLNGHFNLVEGKWLENPNPVLGTITPYKVSEQVHPDGSGRTIVYESILVPQTVSRLDFEFVVNNRHFSFHTPQSPTFESNSLYEFQININ